MKNASIITVLLVGIAFLAGCDKFPPSSSESIERGRQAQIQTEVLRAQTAQQKRLMELQETVAKACAARGDILTFVQGNVLCSPRPK